MDQTCCRVRPQVRKMEADVKNLRDNPQTTLLEGLHSVAYTGGLGRPLIVPEGLLGGLNAGGCRACGRICASGLGWFSASLRECSRGWEGQARGCGPLRGRLSSIPCASPRC